MNVPVMGKGDEREKKSTLVLVQFILYIRATEIVCEQHTGSWGYMTKSTEAVVFIRSWPQTP